MRPPRGHSGDAGAVVAREWRGYRSTRQRRGREAFVRGAGQRGTGARRGRLSLPLDGFLAHRSRWPRRTALGVAALALTFALYVGIVRPWHQRWGATSAEVARAMPGDGLVARPQEVTTRAITIRARPRHIWPWLAQMGRGRGGLYSYDTLDELAGVLDGPSADSLLPEFQRLEAGDTIPVGGGPGWPVAIARPNEVLLLDIHQEGAHVTWVFVLYQLSPTETRLVTRVRARLPWTWKTPLLMAALDPAEFLMVRRQLLGIRERAERLARREE